LKESFTQVRKGRDNSARKTGNTRVKGITRWGKKKKYGLKAGEKTKKEKA